MVSFERIVGQQLTAAWSPCFRLYKDVKSKKKRPYYIEFLLPSFQRILIDRFFDSSGRLRGDMLPHVATLEVINFHGSGGEDLRWQLGFKLDTELGDWMRDLFHTDAHDPHFPISVHGGRWGEEAKEDVIDSIKLLIGGTAMQELHWDYQAKPFEDEDQNRKAATVLENTLSMEIAASLDHSCHLAVATDRDEQAGIEPDIYHEISNRFYEKEGASVDRASDMYHIFAGTGLVWHGGVRHAGCPVPRSLQDTVHQVNACIQWKDRYFLDDLQKLCEVAGLNRVSRFFVTTFPREMCGSREEYLQAPPKESVFVSPASAN